MTQTYATLAVVCGFPVEVEVLRRGISSPPEGGFVQARQLRSSVSRQSLRAETRLWTVVFKDMGTTERDAILAANSAAGDALPIAWEPPPPDDGATIPVRIVGTLTIEYDRSALAFRSAPVTLEEVI